MVKNGINIRLVGVKKAMTALHRAKVEAQNTKPLYNKAIIIVEKSTAKTFRMQGRPRWRKSKRAKEQGGKTLQDTGRLFQSVTATTTDSVREVTRTQLRVGTKLIYAPSHQFGYPGRGIPKRPFLGIYDEDKKKLTDVFGQDLSNRLRVVTSA